MRKIIALLLALLMLFALCACGDDSTSPKADNVESSGNSYKAEDFYGLWIEKSSGVILNFFSDPMGNALKITSADGKRSSTRFGWLFEGDTIIFKNQDDIVIYIDNSGDTIQLKYIDGVYVREEAYYSSIPTLKVGETVETDIVRFTLNEYKLADLLGLDYANWLTPIKGTGGLGSGSDKIFVWGSFSVTNLSKREISGYDVCDFTVEFDDGYIFDDAVYSSSPKSSTSSSISKTTGLASIQPLGTIEFIGYVKCTSLIKTNRDAPLRLIVSLPCSTGKTQFAYDLGVDDTAAFGEEALAVSECIDKAINNLMFVNKYIGNQAPNGSRQVASSLTDDLLSAFSEVDEAYINSSLPETAATLPIVKENIESICNMIFEMNRTNSDKDVYTMKSLAGETVAMLEELLTKEYSAFN